MIVRIERLSIFVAAGDSISGRLVPAIFQPRLGVKSDHKGRSYKNAAGATLGLGNQWKAINWQKVKAEVKRLQMHIAKAVREGESANRIKVLQWILSHSFSARLLAVRS